MKVTFETERVRVYFNRAADAPKVWSVDFGPGTAEISCDQVVTDSLASSHYDPHAGDKTGPSGEDLHAPRAWFNLVNVRVTIQDAVVFLTPPRESRQ